MIMEVAAVGRPDRHDHAGQETRDGGWRVGPGEGLAGLGEAGGHTPLRHGLGYRQGRRLMLVDGGDDDHDHEDHNCRAHDDHAGADERGDRQAG